MEDTVCIRVLDATRSLLVLYGLFFFYFFKLIYFINPISIPFSTLVLVQPRMRY